MDKIQPGSGHLDSSATHRAVQSSTILDRRYVKRPSATNAGKYSAAARTRANSVAPSRLINLGVRSTDLEVAQIREAIHEEVDEDTSQDNYLTEDAIALNLEVSEATASQETTPQETFDNDLGYSCNSYDSYNPTDIQNPTNYTTAAEENAMNHMDHTDYTETNKAESSPVSMYALEAMKRSMMQDLVSNNSETVPASFTAQETMPTTAATVNDSYSEHSTIESQPIAQPAIDNNNSYYDASVSPTAEPIDMISKATSDALASIRIATESAEVSDQMASLKAFANSIKADNSPEMAELGNTIEKFANVAMKSTKAKEEAENKVALSVNRSPRIAQSSARLNRPNPTIHRSVSNANPHSTAISRNPKVTSINRTPTTSNISSTARRPATRRTTTVKKPTSAQRHAPDNRALEQALRSVATMDDERTTPKSKKTRSKKNRRKGGFTRFALALGCAGACIAGIVYFVGSNIPDISVQVAAMQTGIDAAYPSYIPRDYSLGDISSENGRLTMSFNGPNGSSFTLVEEKSSWDSSALQRNYVEPTWGENFTTTHEQGVTIFLSGSDAAWVNGGILYKITSSSNDLTKKQLRNIVTSM